MIEKEIKIQFEKKQIAKQKFDIKQNLTKIRLYLLDIILIPFVFLNDEEKEIPKESESTTLLEDILDGKNLYLKKIVKRKVLGSKINQIGDIDIYEYPLIYLTEQQKQSSTNILAIGETGHGKSTWINALINYLLGIQLEEKIRYNLFNEKKLQEDYQKMYGKKKEGSSVTDKPAVYNIEPSAFFNNPIRIIDTAGYGDTRNDDNHNFDEKITVDIKEFLESSTINSINAICLIMKASENRLHDRIKYVLDKLLSLFGKDVMRNIIIIFTHAPPTGEIKALEILNSSDSPFKKFLGSVDNYKYFSFDSKIYFSKSNSGDVSHLEAQFNENLKNFGEFFKYIFGLQSISLESTKQVIKDRLHIKNNIINLTNHLRDTMMKVQSAMFNEKQLSEWKSELNILQNSDIPLEEYEDTIIESSVIDETKNCENGWYVLYCNFHNKVCHNKCKGSKEGWNSSTYGCNMISTFGSKCSECNCLDVSHSFNNSYIIKKEIKNSKKVKKYRENKNAIDKKEETMKTMKKEINYLEAKLKLINAEVTSALMDAINLTFQLALKDDELNNIALKKDKKYGFTQKVIKENINEENKTEAFDELINTLPDIENICQSQESKKNKVKEIQEKLKKNNN